ncbi:hypothetical protein [Kocuria rosea]|uniref:hypothetical protein n=1 Tax=Kocuria rosea TaxID=1275 RepID=UPI0010A2D5AE|nr:hypothetical protein [Kocuria rosea]THE19011.1 hypothetical protein E1J17_03155 [Kocuria rosea]WJZ68096.1 hypothetical protein QR564_08485 [Kocuria rosea]
MTVLPVVAWTTATFLELTAAPMHQYCPVHEPVISDRYAAAVDWTVCRDSAEGHHLDPQTLQQICAHLQTMRTPKAQAVHAALLRLTGTP